MRKKSRKAEKAVDDNGDILAKIRRRKAQREARPFPDELWIALIEGTSPAEFKLITELTAVPEGTKVAAYGYSQHGVTKHSTTLEHEDDAGEDDEESED